jgi:hypothetical protein
VVWDADDIAGVRFIRQFPVAREKQDRAVDGNRFARADLIELHAAFELARTQPHKRDPVTVHRVHIGLNLEDKASHPRIIRRNRCRLGRLRAGGRGETRKRINEFINAEIFERGAKVNWREITAAIRLGIKIGIACGG